MRISRAAIGLLLLALLPQAVTAQGGVYDLMREVTNRELLRNEAGGTVVEGPVNDFVRAVLRREPLTREDVSRAVSDSPGFCRDTWKDPISCAALRTSIRSLTLRESRTRALGRDLQIIAGSAEAPVQDFAAEQLNLPLRAQGILRIWRAGTLRAEAGSSGSVIRVAEMGPRSADALQAVADRLADLRLVADDTEQFTGAVWRYQYGVRPVRGADPSVPLVPANAARDQPERQFLAARWERLEHALNTLLLALPPPRSLTPPLREGETVLFRLPAEGAESARVVFDTMNVRPWATITRRADGRLIADAGLQWVTAVQPVLPSLCREQPERRREGCDPIPGGQTFPPLSMSGSGLCLGPLAQNGYLCRPADAPRGRSACAEAAAQDPNRLILTRCAEQSPVRRTVSGPDVCAQENWRIDPPAPACQVRITCENAADPTGAFPVQVQGGQARVPLGDGGELPAPYEAIKLLVHSRQRCAAPESPDPFLAGTPEERNRACCRLSRDAYRSACEAMQADGLFGTGAQLERQTLAGRPLNSLLCADILADGACRARGTGTCQDTVTREDTDQSVAQQRTVLLSSIRGWWGARVPAPAPGWCAWIRDGTGGARSHDPRVDAWIRSTEEQGQAACLPGQTTRYQNTIGNNLCMIGRCVEETIEGHRIVPGRQALTAQDQAYPYEACMAPLRDGGTLTALPPDLSTAIPPYRPGLLAQTLDTALCQTVGLPAGTPPARCAFQASRRLSLPLPTAAETALDLLDQDREARLPAEGISLMAEAVATRIGTELYRSYLEESARNVSRITDAASRLLDRFSTVTFPTTMCPVGAEDMDAFLQSPLCPAPPRTP